MMPTSRALTIRLYMVIVLPLLVIWASSVRISPAGAGGLSGALDRNGGLIEAIDDDKPDPPATVADSGESMPELMKRVSNALGAGPIFEKPGQVADDRSIGMANLEKQLETERGKLERLRTGKSDLTSARSAVSEAEARLHRRRQKSDKEIQRLVDLSRRSGGEMDIDAARKVKTASLADEKKLKDAVARERARLKQAERASPRELVDWQAERVRGLERQLDLLDATSADIPPSENSRSPRRDGIEDAISRGLERESKEDSRDFKSIDELRKKRQREGAAEAKRAVNKRADEKLKKFTDGLPENMNNEEKQELIDLRERELDGTRAGAVRAVEKQRDAETRFLEQQPEGVINAAHLNGEWQDAGGRIWIIAIHGSTVTVTSGAGILWAGTMEGSRGNLTFKPTRINQTSLNISDAPNEVKWNLLLMPEHRFKGRLDIDWGGSLKFTSWGNNWNYDRETFKITDFKYADYSFRTYTLVPAYKFSDLKITGAGRSFAGIHSVPVGARFCVEVRFDGNPKEEQVSVVVTNEIDEKTVRMARRVTPGIYRTNPIRVRDMDRDVTGDVDARPGEIIEATYQRKKDGPTFATAIPVTTRQSTIAIEDLDGRPLQDVQTVQPFHVRIRIADDENESVPYEVDATFKSPRWLLGASRTVRVHVYRRAGGIVEYWSNKLSITDLGLSVKHGETVTVNYGNASASVVVSQTHIGVPVARMKRGIAHIERNYQNLLSDLDEAERKGNVSGEEAKENAETRKWLQDKLNRIQQVKALMDQPDRAEGSELKQYFLPGENRFDDYSRYEIGSRTNEFLTSPWAFQPKPIRRGFEGESIKMKAAIAASRTRKEGTETKLGKMLPVYAEKMPHLVGLGSLAVGASRAVMAGLNRLPSMGGSGLLGRGGFKRGTTDAINRELLAFHRAQPGRVARRMAADSKNIGALPVMSTNQAKLMGGHIEEGRVLYYPSGNDEFLITRVATPGGATPIQLQLDQRACAASVIGTAVTRSGKPQSQEFVAAMLQRRSSFKPTKFSRDAQTGDVIKIPGRGVSPKEYVAGTVAVADARGLQAFKPKAGWTRDQVIEKMESWLAAGGQVTAGIRFKGGGGHAVLVEKVTPNFVIVGDPGLGGSFRWPRIYFERMMAIGDTVFIRKP